MLISATEKNKTGLDISLIVLYSVATAMILYLDEN